MNSCLFCGSNRSKNSFLPSTFFNEKQFDYRECMDCGLHYISPIPSDEDLLKMYPPSYQSGIDPKIHANPYKKLIGLRFSYGVHYDLLKKIGKDRSILDFGCGAANFLINARNEGFQCDGLEFNPLHVEVLRDEIKEAKFYELNEFLNSDIQYDVIRLSNVLEHFTDPHSMIARIKERIKPGGYLLIEGPIEINFNLAMQFRKLFFKLRGLLNKQYLASHTPTHIIFSNRKNQLKFFEDAQFEKVHFEIDEAEWPFPYQWKDAKSLIMKINYMVAKLSILISSMNKNWGNTFIYLGKS